MKGIVFNLLEEVVAAHVGGAAWDGMLGRAGFEGAYTSLGNYPDQEFATLLEALAALRGTTPRDTLRWFGHCSMPYLAERYPEFFSPHKSLRPFLLSLNDVIHAEVRKLYPGAVVPTFGFQIPPPTAEGDGLVIHYRSKRKLCPLAEGFIAGAADYFRQPVTLSQRCCMLEGADECVIVCVIGRRA
jgi:heme-NO-binding protein